MRRSAFFTIFVVCHLYYCKSIPFARVVFDILNHYRGGITLDFSNIAKPLSHHTIYSHIANPRVMMGLDVMELLSEVKDRLSSPLVLINIVFSKIQPNSCLQPYMLLSLKAHACEVSNLNLELVS